MARPTGPQQNRTGELKQETQDAGTLLQKIILQQVAPINEKVKNLPQVTVGKSEKKDM